MTDYAIMAKRATGFWLGLVAVAFSLPATGDEQPLELAEEQVFKLAMAKVAPSVVRIETVGGLEQVGDVLTSTGPTTGVVVSESGDIITSSFNFLSQPASILVTLPDGQRFPAKQIANDKLRMLTLIRIEASQLPVPVAAPKQDIKVGEWSIALGRTYGGDTPSVSVGIISALERVWGKAIQTDAKISPVNYGGPLVDTSGRVQGILVPLSPTAQDDTAGVEWYDSGIGFAIPFEDVLRVVPLLQQGTDIVPGLMGISFRFPDAPGALAIIEKVRPGSPAAVAGLKVGDAIEAAQGKPATKVAQVRHIVGQLAAGEGLALGARREGELQSFQLTLASRLEPFDVGYLGILPGVIDEAGRVTVRYVFPKGPADKAGIVAGDILTLPEQGGAGLRWVIRQTQAGTTVSVDVLRGVTPQQLKVDLGSLSKQSLAESLPPRHIAPVADDAGKGPKVGQFRANLSGFDQEYWAFVPDSYVPGGQYSLIVWLHPAGETGEKDLLAQWKGIAAQRGIILVGPQAERQLTYASGDSKFIIEVTQEMLKTYSIAPHRVVLHGSGQGGLLAWFISQKERSLFAGLCNLPTQVPETLAFESDPDAVQSFWLYGSKGDPLSKRAATYAAELVKRKIPATFREIEYRPGEYLSSDEVERLAQWLEQLDAI